MYSFHDSPMSPVKLLLSCRNLIAILWATLCDSVLLQADPLGLEFPFQDLFECSIGRILTVERGFV